jgi:hypothetical protein
MNAKADGVDIAPENIDGTAIAAKTNDGFE